MQIPPHKANELLKVFMSTYKPAYLDFLKKVEHWIPQISGEKYKTYAIYECPDDKIIDGMTALFKRFNFYASVEGYTFKCELLAEAADAIKDMLGK